MLQYNGFTLALVIYLAGVLLLRKENRRSSNTNRNTEKIWFKRISFHVLNLGQSSFRRLEPWKINSAPEYAGSILQDVFI